MPGDRTRTYSWEDPLALSERMAGSSGLEVMQMMASGELPPPPIAETLGFRLVEASHGHAVFECEPAEFHYNPIGIVHAGLALGGGLSLVEALLFPGLLPARLDALGVVERIHGGKV